MPEAKTKRREKVEAEQQPCCIVVMAGPRFGETIPLEQGENMVGSDPEARIYFSTTLLTDRHFVLICEGRQVILKREDGITLVNNSPTEKARLKDGDLIVAGGISLRYVEEGSRTHFYVGDLFYGRERRQYPRFNTASTAYAYLPDEDRKLEIVSIRTVSRGGIGLFSKENAAAGKKIQVILYSMNSKQNRESMSAESIMGTVLSTALWKGSLFLINIRFLTPVSPHQQPNLFHYLMELEKFL